MIFIAEKTSQDLFNKELSALMEKDSFEDFCNLINSKDLKVSFDIPSSVTPSKALKYVELMLYKQKHQYRIDYINYLVSNRYTENVIRFFDSLKDLDPVEESQIWENPIKELLQNIVNNKDLDLLHYLLECPVVMLGDFKSTNYIVSVFIKNNFQEGLNYLKYDPSFEIYVVQEAVKQLKDEVEVDWTQFQTLLNLSDLDLFKSIVAEHVESEKVKNNFDWEILKAKSKGLRNKTMIAVMPKDPPITIMSGEAQGIYPVFDPNYYNPLGLKSKYYQYQRAGYEAPSSEGEALWLKYKLETKLSSKHDEKGVKI